MKILMIILYFQTYFNQNALTLIRSLITGGATPELGKHCERSSSLKGTVLKNILFYCVRYDFKGTVQRDFQPPV